MPEPPKTRSSDNPWPQFPRIFKMDYGHEEVVHKFGQDPRVFSTLSKEFLCNENNHVKGVRTVKVEWTKDELGRWKMSEVPNSEIVCLKNLLF